MKIFYGQKIKTEIEGLDQLLFGGLYLNCPDVRNMPKSLSIAIYGDKGTGRALLAMQLLYGITRSLRGITFRTQQNDNTKELKFASPLFYTDNKGVDNLSDMLLDFLTAQTISKIVESNAQGKKRWGGSCFCNAIFDTSRTVPIPLDRCKLDKYIGEEILVYNIHTNALHLALPTNQYRREDATDDPVFVRKDLSVEAYMEAMRQICPSDSGLGFFNVNFYSEQCQNQDTLGSYLKMSSEEIIPCLVIDKANVVKEGPDDSLIRSLKDRALVAVFISDEEPDRKYSSFDMIIELRRNEDKDLHYVFNQLCINKSAIQDTAMGWHIFKKREYGFEVYPSTHVLLQRRRHMPKGVLVSQRGIFEKTFQRYIDEVHDTNHIAVATDFIQSKKCPQENGYQKIFNEYFQDTEQIRQSPINILKDILISQGNSATKCESTVIIGPPNTFKRFFTLSSTFFSSSNQRHTLNILLDKEDSVMFRRFLCPAYVCCVESHSSFKENKTCQKCYDRIHLSNIRMGCISSDEFFFYLIKQIKVSRQSEHTISRIVIDDLQKIEFCFPALHADKLFLTTLISICKDYEVDLFMLCDKSSSLVPALRAQVDNVICTERIGKSSLNVYIERYAGYSRPSQIWKCKFDNILGQFYCDDNNRFEMNDRCFSEEYIHSMDDYWAK